MKLDEHMNATGRGTLGCGILLVRLFEYVDHRVCYSRQLRVRRLPVCAGPAGTPISPSAGAASPTLSPQY